MAEDWKGSENQNGAVGPHYFVHYQGWKKTWDEWVPEERLLKHTEENVARQKALVDAQKAEAAAAAAVAAAHAAEQRMPVQKRRNHAKLLLLLLLQPQAQVDQRPAVVQIARVRLLEQQVVVVVAQSEAAMLQTRTNMNAGPRFI